MPFFCFQRVKQAGLDADTPPGTHLSGKGSGMLFLMTIARSLQCCTQRCHPKIMQIDDDDSFPVDAWIRIHQSIVQPGRLLKMVLKHQGTIRPVRVQQ